MLRAWDSAGHGRSDSLLRCGLITFNFKLGNADSLHHIHRVLLFILSNSPKASFINHMVYVLQKRG